jgi:hypothetical protein
VKKIRAARPKTGRNTFSHTVALTREQIEFLNRFPNASEQLRKMLDAVMKAHDDFEAKFPVLALHTQIELLEKEMNNAELECERYYQEHRDQIYKTGADSFWDETTKTVKHNPPLPTREAQYHFKILTAMQERRDAIKARIQELKGQVS